MNVLTQIKNQRAASLEEARRGVPDAASWHARFAHSAYVFVGGLPSGLTEGDLLAVFAQYGEVVDVHLVKDKDTGASRGFAFLAYEDQRSTVVAVDNLSGARVGGRTLRVEHVDDYRIKLAELEGGAGPAGAPPPHAQGDNSREDAAAAAAAADGATVVPADEARGGGRGGGDAAVGGDAPWADSGSVFALLRSSDPLPPKKAAAAKEDDEDREARRRRKEEKRTRRAKRDRSPRRERSR